MGECVPFPLWTLAPGSCFLFGCLFCFVLKVLSSYIKKSQQESNFKTSFLSSSNIKLTTEWIQCVN